MAIKEITVRLPEKILAELDRLATKRKLDRDEMLTRLVESHLRYREQERRIAELTLSYLGKESRPSRPISEVQIDAGKVAQAMVETYGTSDIIEIINASRGEIVIDCH
jgi:metal-responsive CopG/Arc/MetJ family transcriptional regulator